MSEVFSRAGVLGIVVAAAGWLAAVMDAAPDAPSGVEQQLQFAARTQGVLVDVEVLRDGHPYPGLAEADFELRDNGVPQAFEMVKTADAPINAVLALDVSASTAGQPLADLTTASRALLDGLRTGDHVALTTFNQTAAQRVPLTTDLTAMRTALSRIVPAGDTALLDGVYVALVSTQVAVGASLVVVYTDGADTASWLQANEVRDAAARSNAVVDAVVIQSGHRWTELKDLVDATGGQVVIVKSTADLAGEFARILREFRSRYLLTFVPRGVEPGGFHRLDVHVRRGGLAVHARAGYFSDAPGRLNPQPATATGAVR